MPSRSRRTLVVRTSCSHRMTPPSYDGSSITLGPGSRVRLTPRAPRSRRTTTESRCFLSRSVVKQRALGGQMRIAPPANGAGGAIGSLLRSERGRYLSGTPVPRATCILVPVIVQADLTAFRLDPETARRDAPTAELQRRARARRANASRKQVSKSEVNGGLHRRSSWHVQLLRSLRWFTSMDSLGIAARDRARSAGD